MRSECELRYLDSRENTGSELRTNPGGLGRPPGLSQRRKVLLYSTTNELLDRFTDFGRVSQANQPIFLTQASMSSGKTKIAQTTYQIPDRTSAWAVNFFM
jgi:hypothetical protein